MPEPELSDADRALLEFEEQWGSRMTAAKQEAIVSELDLRAARYQQLLHSIIDKPAALEEMPDLVARLHRLRARRAAARATRTFSESAG